ncbi:tRNA (guanine(10)-N(2))-dimethyltransferase, partial [Candidatus Woesearchaeota archaeon]|nr:tRNA (guanine(10)-N(2))-dimethyltransferase [Candidatus Woesearchaeota archaeon]
MYKLIQEGQAEIYIPKQKKISKKLPVFYNPVMELNRTISILVLKNVSNKNMQIGLPLAGTGIRGIRFLKELSKNKIKFIYFNDYSKKSVNLIKKNLKQNRLKSKIRLFSKDANEFILENRGFDYIDIDPFGTPNPYLDSAVKALSRNSILAVTATDTAPLAGTYPTACKRKYWASPKLDSNKHETGLRILIRKCQLIAAQYEKALTPILS